MKVTVINNQITGVTDMQKGTALQVVEWQYYKTVDQLFQLISSINKDSVAAFQVAYDPKYGYPTSLSVIPNAHIADEEFGYDSDNLTGIY